MANMADMAVIAISAISAISDIHVLTHAVHPRVALAPVRHGADDSITGVREDMCEPSMRGHNLARSVSCRSDHLKCRFSSLDWIGSQ